MNINWYPGHMAKTKRILIENLKLIDVVIELLDARIPWSSKNPVIDELLKTKPRVVVLNKCDLADSNISRDWGRWYSKNNQEYIFVDSLKGKGINELKTKLSNMMKEKNEKLKQRGRIFRPTRTMVVGIPNVGKSSFINKIAKKTSALTGDKPGVTKTKQWIRVSEGIELLDTPGILWPKFEDENVGLNLAYTGAIKDDVVDTVEVCIHLFDRLKKIYPENIMQRYKLESVDKKAGYELLNEAGQKRGCIVRGGEVDLARIAAIVLDELRGGKLGKITLESPSDITLDSEG